MEFTADQVKQWISDRNDFLIGVDAPILDCVEILWMVGYGQNELMQLAKINQDDIHIITLKEQLEEYPEKRNEILESINYFRDIKLGCFLSCGGTDYLYGNDGKIYMCNDSEVPCIKSNWSSFDSLMEYSLLRCKDNKSLKEADKVLNLKALENIHTLGEEYKNVFTEYNHSDVFTKLDVSVKYNGYKNDVLNVIPHINRDTIYNAYSDLDMDNMDLSNVQVTVYDKDTELLTSSKGIYVLSRNAYIDNYSGEYETYLLCNIYAYLLSKYSKDGNVPMIWTIAKWRSGFIDDMEKRGDNTSSKVKKILNTIFANDGIKPVRNFTKPSKNDKNIEKLIKNSDEFKWLTSVLESSKDNKDWSIAGLPKLVRRIKMGSRKAVYANNAVSNNIEKSADLLEPNPDIDLDGDNRVEAEEKQPVHTADLYPTRGKIKSQIGTSGSASKATTINTDNVSEQFLIESNCNYFKCDDKIVIFEDNNYNTMLRNTIYKNRIRKNSEVLDIYSNIKKQVPRIKYAYTDLKRYEGRNLYIDLSYYNEIFFRNNIYENKRGKDLYLEYLKRLLQDKRLIAHGYTKNTIIIPVMDWNENNDTKMWIYTNSINPISIIYNLMITNRVGLEEVFGDSDVLFCGYHNYFKINFSNIRTDSRNIANIFMVLIKKLLAQGKNEVPEPDPIDEPMGDSKKAIKADIIDKLEKSKKISIDKINVDKKEKDVVKITKGSAFTGIIEPEPINKAPDSVEDANKSTVEKEKEELVKAIDIAASTSTNVDDALDKLDDERIKKLIADLAMEENKTGMNKARASRMSKLHDDFLQKEIAGKTVKDMLAEDNTAIESQIEETALPISSINEEWKHVKYINFGKSYDMDADIVSILEHMSTWGYPIGIISVDVIDNSTSEDYVDLWIVKCEDSFGKRFTLKFDVPKFMENNRYMKLRGNYKTIETQYFLMPIIKTDTEDCQIVSNYNKIFIRRYYSNSGKSCIYSDIIMRGLKKIEDKNIIINYGDNTRICNKYELPSDYIDLAGVYDKINTKDYIFYFNQDEIREKYKVDESKGLPYAVEKHGTNPNDWTVVYYDPKMYQTSEFITSLIYTTLCTQIDGFREITEKLPRSSKYTFSIASILSSKIPLILIAAYSEGLTSVMNKAKIKYEFMEKINSDIKSNINKDWIRFADGYIVYENTPEASLLMNGLKECDTMGHSLAEVDTQSMYIEMLDGFGGRIKADGLDNFKDCMLDPITLDIMKDYGLPTDYVESLIYANNLLVDNKYIKHTKSDGRRIRRGELIAGYVYKALTDSYCKYAIQCKHTRSGAPMTIKQSAVIDRLFEDPTEKDLSINSMATDVEFVNAVSTKGLTGMNSERSYNLDKRTYDESMLNILGMSTGFAGNVGVTRQATIDMNVEGKRGYVKSIDGDVSKLNDVKTLTLTEAITPFSSTHDDPFRTAMNYVQNAKHSMRVAESSPLLVTCGADEALPYMCSDMFSHKAKGKGIISELTDEYMIIDYNDGTPSEYIDLSMKVMKNSDGGFEIPLKLDVKRGYKVGSRVKEGDIVAYDKLSASTDMGENDNLAYCPGVLAKVALLVTEEGFEDSAKVSKRLSDATATDIIKIRQVYLPKETSIYDVLPIGSNIEEGDRLMVFQTPYESEDLQILQRNLADDEERLSDLGKVPIKAETTGTLVDIRIYRTVEIDELSPSLKKLVRAYEKPILEKKKIMEEHGIPTYTLPPTYKLEPTGKLKNVVDGVLIEFCQQYKDTLAVGDKIVWKSANKGVNKGIFPEGLEPYTDLRPNEVIDGFITNTSTNGRMVKSIEEYGALAKLMIELGRTCKEMAGIDFDDTKV